jgi:phenylacetate-CoA ligase
MNKTLIFQKSPRFLKYIFAYLNGLKLNYWRKYNRKYFNTLLIEREKWTSIQFENWQNNELIKMLNYARTHVPFYKIYWDNQQNIDYSKLENWPILEKQTIRSQPDLFLSDEYNKKDLFEMHTSGTSGKPMTFWLTRESLGIWYGMYDLRIKNWNGVFEEDAFGAFGGQLIVNTNTKSPPFWVWNQPMNQLYFSSYHIQEDSVEAYVEAMFKYKLQYLLGYVSSIYNIAKIAKQKKLKTPKFKLIITNAEPLLKHQREIIEEVFNCKVIQTYSGCEYAFGGSEDLSGKMYLWPEAGIMEVINEKKELSLKGHGEFIITGLLNKAMPLIRYRVGDSGTICKADDFQNSRRFKYLSEITGRTDDLIKSPDGRLIGRLDPVFKAEFNISEAQIIQETLTEFVVNIVPLDSYTELEGVEIIERLKERVSDKITVNINKVVAIPRSSNGKFKAVISKIK